MSKLSRTVLAVALLLSVAVSCRPPAPPPAPEGTPRLLLLLVVDQLEGDRLVRLAPALDGGIRKLLDEGVSFAEAHHAHAGTTTGPGHATLATGCHPSGHGVISNYWIDPDTGEDVYSAGDDNHSRAPSRLECSTLGDWLKERYPASRVFSVSTKDRSAVFMGGRQADGAYWYAGDGTFESSDYYPEPMPPWLEELNAEDRLTARFGQAWTPLPFDAERLESLGISEYDLGPLEEDFPHAIGGPSLSPGSSFYRELVATPWIDEHILEMARRMVTAEELGADAYPDLLALGFSTTDVVGHGVGPDSLEFFDILARLDQQLAEFFDWLDGRVGLEHVAIALSSDHGSVPLPELRIAQELPARRAGAAEILCMQSVEAALDSEFGERQWLKPGPFFSRVPAVSEEVRARVRSLVEACPSVSRVWFADEVSDEGTDEMQRRFARSYYAGRSPDFFIQWDEYFLVYDSVASSHGTPYAYDTHVPLVFWRSGLSPAVRSEPVETVDLAPTLAAWSGVEPPADVVGDRLLPVGPDGASTPAAGSP